MTARLRCSQISPDPLNMEPRTAPRRDAGLPGRTHLGLALAILSTTVLTPPGRRRRRAEGHHAPAFAVSIAHATDRELGAAPRAQLETARRMAGVPAR
jgi:hypothetical protein